MPRVTVIIPSYNHEKYVAEAIQSVLDQTFQDFEIIITDDGSTDGTVNEIKRFKDPRIKLFTFEKNKGAAVAVTNCLQNSEGDYIAMLSSDDIFLPDKLEKQVKFLDDHIDSAAVFSYAQIIDEDGNDFADKNHLYYSIFKQPNRTRFEWLNYFFYHANCLCHPSVLIRRELYVDLAPPDLRYAQLGDFNRWIKICMKHEIHIIPENLIKFRIRKDDLNVSGNRPEVKIRDVWEHSQILNNYLNINKKSDLLKIFPKLEDSKDKINKSLIPFFIASLALEVKDSKHQIFAITTLYNMMGRRNIVKQLAKIGFEYIDFIKLTGHYDIFNLYDTTKDRIFNNSDSKDNYIKTLEQTVCLSKEKFKATIPSDSGNSITSGIDVFNQHANYIEIAGWAYMQGKNSVSSKISLIFKSDKDSYLFETIPVKRPDVTAYFKSFDYDDSGFSALIPNIILDEGEYNIIIHVKKDSLEAFRQTGKKVTIKHQAKI